MKVCHKMSAPLKIIQRTGLEEVIYAIHKALCDKPLDSNEFGQLANHLQSKLIGGCLKVHIGGEGAEFFCTWQEGTIASIEFPQEEEPDLHTKTTNNHSEKDSVAFKIYRNFGT